MPNVTLDKKGKPKTPDKLEKELKNKEALIKKKKVMTSLLILDRTCREMNLTLDVLDVVLPSLLDVYRQEAKKKSKMNEVVIEMNEENEKKHEELEKEIKEIKIPE